MYTDIPLPLPYFHSAIPRENKNNLTACHRPGGSPPGQGQRGQQRQRRRAPRGGGGTSARRRSLRRADRAGVALDPAAQVLVRHPQHVRAWVLDGLAGQRGGAQHALDGQQAPLRAPRAAGAHRYT
eukprot:CAMPEP_0197605964 /NCGR_PEP_ID=MMETSP1326-20131121/44110_1 /TAXON_ID=1155430 /ORGANISM="Genus nov. species nov., Strain RCC2288" /LENGTH=125 /DNA_ID=CAMNT_0043173815 /DNA_START=585 /DNA_END=959 /DNA_ORIENTATION=-